MNTRIQHLLLLLALLTMASCTQIPSKPNLQAIASAANPPNSSKTYTPKATDIIVSRKDYAEKMHGFWLGQCIANWTGLVTEMDKIGNIGDIKTGDFYTRDNWGAADQPSIWSDGQTSELSPTIDFVFENSNGIWGADDDTDIEYIYQHLMHTHQTSQLTAEQIRDGWLSHIKKDEENYLWVSNQKAFDLMQEGMLPPATSHPSNNPHFEMIDAQLTTEIFGLYAPTRPDIALQIASLPIQTSAQNNAKWIAEFYVIMHALASSTNRKQNMQDKTQWLAEQARKHLPNDSYAAKMYDFVKRRYTAGIPWEQTRDEIYKRYQVNQADGYTLTAQNLYCNGCFAAGINFAASLVSLFYGEGDLKQTIKIGTLAGWDSDNPTATWGGLLGFMLGKRGVENAFNRTFSEKYNIHRTRQGFPNQGIDTFSNMAEQAVQIIDRVVQEKMGGGIDLEQNTWYIPSAQLQQ